MIGFKKLMLSGVVCAGIALTTGCSDSSDGKGATNPSISLDSFNNFVFAPETSSPLNSSAIAPLLFVLQTQGFETEYQDSSDSAPHQIAWRRLDIWEYANGRANMETVDCEAIAKNQSGESGSGRGTVTISSDMGGDTVGYVEHAYNGCVINQNVYTGTRRFTVFEKRREFSDGVEAASFQWEYEGYYWGVNGLQYSLDGVIAFEEQVQGFEYNYPYKSTSNYRYSTREGYRYELQGLESVCQNSVYDTNSVGGWRCEIDSGQIVLNDLGVYSVETLSPIYQTVWKDDGRLQISDQSGGHLVFWGEKNSKRVTAVTSAGGEQTFVVESSVSDPVELTEAQPAPADSVFTVVDTKLKQWDRELYSTSTDEYIFFDRDDSRFVDAFQYGQGQSSSARRIDLVEPAYEVNVISEGGSLYSGHDGSIRSILLVDPELVSTKRPIGFGKIVGIYDDSVVAYEVEGFNHTHIVSYQWDHVNELVTETNYLGTPRNNLIYKNGLTAEPSDFDVYLQTDSVDNSRYKFIQTGETRGYLKFFDNELIVTGGGALVKCNSSCIDNGVYWKSVNEAILAKYPSEGSHIVVAAATDTEGLYTNPSYMVFATVSKSSWWSDYSHPESGDTLWIVDLNDMSRIKRLSLPVNELSSPKVRLNVRELFNRKGDNSIVGVGSWGLLSGRENTVMFELDLDEINFE